MRSEKPNTTVIENQVLAKLAIMSGLDKSPKLAHTERMRNFSAGDAKNKFGLLIDTARLEPVVIEKHGRPVAVVCSVEEFERLQREAGEHIDGNPKIAE